MNANMNTKSMTAALTTLAVLAAAVCGPLNVANAQSTQQKSRQNDKNNMRNLGIGLGAGAVHQAVTGKTTNALILGAGAAYSAKKYEDARKAQARESASRRRYGSTTRYRNGKKVGYYTRSAHARR
jgi:hypothetical protein